MSLNALFPFFSLTGDIFRKSNMIIYLQNIENNLLRLYISEAIHTISVIIQLSFDYQIIKYAQDKEIWTPRSLLNNINQTSKYVHVFIVLSVLFDLFIDTVNKTKTNCFSRV